MVVWSVWLLEFCIGAMVLLYGNHRKLYDMKVEKGWIGSSGSRIMAVDTKAAVQSGRMGTVSVVASAFLSADSDAMHRCGYQTLSDDVR